MDLVAGMTAAMSAVGQQRPDIMQVREVHLFIDMMIAEAKRIEAETKPSERPPLAPIDFIDV
jgi:hypothetical protein